MDADLCSPLLLSLLSLFMFKLHLHQLELGNSSPCCLQESDIYDWRRQKQANTNPGNVCPPVYFTVGTGSAIAST